MNKLFMKSPIRKYRTKLFFPFGILSLVLMPILFLSELNNRKVFQKTGYLTVYWYSKHISELNEEMMPDKDHPPRNYAEYELTSNDEANKIRLIDARNAICELSQSQSLKKGVHFKLTDDAKYADLINVFTICLKENVRTFLPNNNDVWVFILDSNKTIEKETFIMPFY
jgi:hypothetical protein